jgi:hypothetical protein
LTGQPAGMKREADPSRDAERAAEAAGAFDLWLHRSLHLLYDGVTREKVPAELLRLIERDRGRRQS